jgi:8-oxo-dGTP pyrophosphatase MutT (NUDIX family)
MKQTGKASSSSFAYTFPLEMVQPRKATHQTFFVYGGLTILVVQFLSWRHHQAVQQFKFFALQIYYEAHIMTSRVPNYCRRHDLFHQQRHHLKHIIKLKLCLKSSQS